MRRLMRKFRRVAQSAFRSNKAGMHAYPMRYSPTGEAPLRRKAGDQHRPPSHLGRWRLLSALKLAAHLIDQRLELVQLLGHFA